MVMENMVGLFITRNRLENIDDLKYLTKLLYLDISSNNLDDISVLKALRGLKYLNISNNAINSVDALKGFDLLTHLYMSVNRVSDLGPLREREEIDGLEVLSFMKQSGRTIDLSPISGFTGLQKLYISENSLKNIDVISSLTDLQIIKAENIDLKDGNVFSPLGKLRKLYLSNNNLREIAFAEELKDLYSLYYLDVDYNCLGADDKETIATLDNLNSNSLFYLYRFGQEPEKCGLVRKVSNLNPTPAEFPVYDVGSGM